MLRAIVAIRMLTAGEAASQDTASARAPTSPLTAHAAVSMAILAPVLRSVHAAVLLGSAEVPLHFVTQVVKVLMDRVHRAKHPLTALVAERGA